MSTFYCLLSRTLKQKINGFYRRCLRIIYYLFQCPSNDLHETFHLPTLEERYRKSIVKRLINIEQNEQELIRCYLIKGGKADFGVQNLSKSLKIAENRTESG